MPATATAEMKKTKSSNRPSKKISLERFLREYSDMEDGYKYEWNSGIIEKSTSMNQEHTTLFLFLSRLFTSTKAFKSGGGLTAETDMQTSAQQLRRPDIAYFSKDQIEKMKSGKKQVAAWVAEIISENDKADKINLKLEEYFRAGVQVVWHIFPASKQVYVYTSPETVTICREKKVCSGAPAIPDFKVTPEELFA